ncbi:MAG: protein kinase [Myxococcales bacterium]|nr:protein kinase [Myxococcales bacterium]
MGLDLDGDVTGEVLGGKYRLERKLGEGGMGVVFAATHLVLDQPVALKLLRSEVASHPDIAERFQREARAAAVIKSENVARVLDVGALDTGEPFMVMEYLEGEDLERVLETRGPLSSDDAVKAILDACLPLAEAHALGIVHRDLKPANLFMARQPGGRVVLKVLDFGISKVKNDTKKLTATSVIMGTPYYMSPEQIRSAAEVDARSDVWALGVILFELLSGKLPFSGDNAASIIAAISMDRAQPLGEVVPGVDEGIARVCEKCLSKDRDYRYRDVGALARALLPFTQDESAKARVSQIERVLGRSGDDPALGTAETVRPPSLVDAEERAAQPVVTQVAPSPKLVVSDEDGPTPKAIEVRDAEEGSVRGVTAIPVTPRASRSPLVVGAALAVVALVAAGGLALKSVGDPGPVSAPSSSASVVAELPPKPSALPSATTEPSSSPSALVALVPSAAPAPSVSSAPVGPKVDKAPKVPVPAKSATASPVASAPPAPSQAAPNIHTMSGLK